MKITNLHSYPVDIGGRGSLLVKIETDENIYGWGASGLTGRELAVHGALKHYKQAILGKNPFQIGAIWQDLYRGQYFEGGRVLTAAISAIDIALHDIKGKALGVPVYELLGGKQRDFVDCFASVRFSTYQDLLHQCKVLIKEGWNVLRLAPAEYENSEGAVIFEPRESVNLLSKWLLDLREEIGTDPVLGIDYHHRLSIPETVSFLQKLQPDTLDFIEEPIRDESPEAYEMLRKMTHVPFAIGEEFASKWQFKPYLEKQLTQFVRLDVCNVGGITESMKVAAMAESQYIDLMPHNPLGPICTAATIHVAAACPNFSYLEEIHTPVADSGFDNPDIFPLQPKLEGSRYVVGNQPGLGIEVNEDWLKKATYSQFDIPRLKKNDGSYTNW